MAPPDDASRRNATDAFHDIIIIVARRCRDCDISPRWQPRVDYTPHSGSPKLSTWVASVLVRQRERMRFCEVNAQGAVFQNASPSPEMRFSVECAFPHLGKCRAPAHGKAQSAVVASAPLCMRQSFCRLSVKTDRRFYIGPTHGMRLLVQRTGSATMITLS